jgi:hypothetical protein
MNFLIALLLLIYVLIYFSNNIEGYDSTRIKSKNQTIFSQDELFYWTPYYGYQPNLSYNAVSRNLMMYPYRLIPDVNYVSYPHNIISS